jgi:hypothetical protein
MFYCTGCLSPYDLSSNIGKPGTSCPPFEFICITEAGQPFLYALAQVGYFCSFLILPNFILMFICHDLMIVSFNVMLNLGITN